MGNKICKIYGVECSRRQHRRAVAAMFLGNILAELLMFVFIRIVAARR